MLEANDDSTDDVASNFFLALTERELETTRSALESAGVDAVKIRHDLEISHVSERSPGAARARFISTRKLIISALLDATGPDFTLAPSRVPDKMVKDMIEHSSKLLQPRIAPRSV